jgi:AFG3 family protein
MFVGVGASRVRDLFKEARASAPCIIFLDEIDAIGRKRGGGIQGGNDERESTLNQLLVEMDGFDTTSNIVILAATNRADVLDPALLRPGRFDRKVQVDKPDIKGRKAIFEIHLQNKTLAGDIETYSNRLASLTPGFAGAEISNICNEAAIFAARRNKKSIDLDDFEAATDRVIAGLESKRIMTAEDKRIVAYHEAGHAVAGWFLEFADPLLKVTIVPRSNGALGFAQYLPKEVFLRTRAQILDIVCMALAGRASEQINFGKVTTGASDDLRRVTEIVYGMVQMYGMNDKIGQLAFPRDQSQFPADKLYSEATAEMMDAEVRIIVEEAYTRTLALITEKQREVVLVAELLIEKETISHNEVAAIIGKR